METITLSQFVTKRKFLKRVGLLFRNIEKQNLDIQDLQSQIEIKKIEEITEKEGETLAKFYVDWDDWHIPSEVYKELPKGKTLRVMNLPVNFVKKFNKIKKKWIEVLDEFLVFDEEQLDKEALKNGNFVYREETGK